MFLTALADSTQSWTTLGYSPLFLPHNLHPTHCIELYDLYRENGLEPDLDSYTALLAMYGEAGDMESIMKVSSLSSYTCTQSTGSHAKPTMQPDLYYINTTIH